MKTILLVLVGVGWIGCGPFLAWFMGRRGYDAFSWLAIGCLIGPSALAIAFLERWKWTPPTPEIVVRGEDGDGAINILVVDVDDQDATPVAKPLVEWFGTCVARISIARVLREGGPIEEQSRAAQLIKEVATRMYPSKPGGVLMFGLTETAIARIVRDEGFHVVVTAAPNPDVARALIGTDALHVDGPEYVLALGPRRSTHDPRLRRTTANWTRR